MDVNLDGLPDEILEFSRSRLTRQGPLVVGDLQLSAAEIVARIGPLLTDERRQRLEQVVAKRTYSFVPVFENPYDLGNISAVMRSCEAFGFLEFDLVIPPGSRFKAANRVARGADKWLDVHLYRSPKDCVAHLHQRGFQVYATHLESAVSIEKVDFRKPTAVVLGNEKDGVSKEMLDAVDGRFIIPMQGFTQSFNISVAAALTFYHAWRERERTVGGGDLSEADRLQVLANYYLRCLDRPEAILSKLMARE
ncbi:MAG: TrmH family RNA methyltransferase [Bdellovibrionales bacterium]